MKRTELDRKYGGMFPDEETAAEADRERLLSQTDSLDGTHCAREDYRRDEGGLRDMEDSGAECPQGQRR